jgi:hypothetical protein
MDLTAAFEELLEKRQARRISISPQSILTQRIHREQLEAIKRASKLTATMAKAASPLLSPASQYAIDRAYSTHPVGHYQ